MSKRHGGNGFGTNTALKPVIRRGIVVVVFNRNQAYYSVSLVHV